MAGWSLSFHHPSSLTLAECERAAATIVGGQIAVEIGEIEGNPRDYYSRSIEVVGEHDGAQLRFATTQSMYSPSDPAPLITSLNVTIASETASFSAKLAIWHRVQEVLVPLGFTEHTLTYGGSEIIDEAQAAGDLAKAQELRDTKASRTAHVSLVSPCTEIEPILAAYPRPEAMSSMGLVDCGLTALPPSFFRFTGLEQLTLDENAFDGSVLRGVALPKLERLSLRGRSLRSIAKEDLAGFPALELLSCAHSSLQHLDPEIVEVCPKLIRVYLDDTPLEKDEPAMAALRARWPRMLWHHHDGHPAPEQPAAKAVRVTAKKAPSTFEKQEAPPELRPFFDAILAAPDDDAPRLALADHLVAHGDRRGEQIRLACELAKLERDDPSYARMSLSLGRLPEFSFFSGTHYPFLEDCGRSRGFVERIKCSGVDFVAHGPVLLEDAPIRVLTLSRAGTDAHVASCAALAKLHTLNLQWVPSEDRPVILGSRHLAGTLRRVAVASHLGSAADVEMLGHELRSLGRLSQLELRGTLRSAAVPALAELVSARRLERLDVTFCTLRPTRIIEELWGRLGEIVRPGRVPRVPFDQGELDLSDPMVSLEQIRALVGTGLYRTTKKLRLSCARNGQKVVTFVATCRAFPELVELSLGGVSDAGVKALAAKAVELDHLAEIHLGEITQDPPCVTDAGVSALARSPRLPALRKIERGQTHDVYASDAREDTETTRIQRDDGTIVESIVGHSLWP